MNLLEWVALGERERIELLQQWKERNSEPNPIYRLAREASKILNKQLESVPEVKDIDIELTLAKERLAPAILVCTSLGYGIKHSAIPDSIATFEVVQIGMAEVSAHFWACCTQALWRLCNWDEGTVRRQIEWVEPYVYIKWGGVHYRGPMFYVAMAMVSTAIPTLGGMELVFLIDDVKREIEDVKEDGTRTIYPIDQLDYDWEKASRRVVLAFLKNGYSVKLLDGPAAEKVA